MNKNRLEAFSDGVIAIIITIMVLEIRVPHEPNLAALPALIPAFIGYILSFIYIGIYWSNHHHLLQAVERVNGRVLWANLHLLFWLSLIPFVTAWMGQNHFAHRPVALYGAVLLLAAVAYYILVRSLIAEHGRDSKLAKAIGKDFKGLVSILLYASAIGTAFFYPFVSVAIYIIVAMMWIIPDRRIEKHVKSIS